MRLLVLLAWLAAATSAASSPPPGLQPPPAPVSTRQPVATSRLGFGGVDNPFEKIARWFFPGGDSQPSPGRAISRGPFVHGPPRHHAPPSPPQHHGPHHGPPHGHQRPKFSHPPSPQIKCNPCNKTPWVPIPHGQYQDGGNVFAVVNGPQLHQGLPGGGTQPNVPVYHHSPLPQGYLPTFDNKPAQQHVDQVYSPSAGGVSSSASGTAPEVVPSIQVASFVSSVEYPIDVIQSPIIDLGSASGGNFKSLSQNEVPGNHNEVPANHNQVPGNHNKDQIPENHQPTSYDVPTIPIQINTDVGAHNGGATSEGSASSFQNVNLHAENSVQQESQHLSEVSITPSVQTSVDLSHEHNKHAENVQVVYPNPEGTVLPPIPTQQQPPLEQPPAPFQIPHFQQPPSAHAPTIFHVGPTAGFPVSGPQRLPPSGFAHPSGPQQPPVFLNIPPHIQTFQHPPRGFTSPGGQINGLRQAPSAPDLSPPPPPSGSAPSGPYHPYRFEFVPPSGNALQNINQQILGTHGTAPPALDFTPWTPASGVPTGVPPTAAAVNVAPLTQTGSHAGNANVNINKRPKQIQIIVPYTVSTQNNQLDGEASGLRGQWHHREVNHQIQESRRVNVTAPPAPENEVTSNVHILASDLRALLRDEQQRLLQQQQQQKLHEKLQEQQQQQIRQQHLQQQQIQLQQQIQHQQQIQQQQHIQRQIQQQEQEKIKLQQIQQQEFHNQQQQRQQQQLQQSQQPQFQHQQQQQNHNQLQPNPNLLRLQHNIDQWTAQEFSNSDYNQNIVNTEERHKSTTAAGTLVPSKNIPQEFFPTSPSPVTTVRHRFFDHEPAGSINHNILSKVTGNKGTKVTKGKTEVPEETTATTEEFTTETTDEPQTTTVEPRRTTWEQALLGYSPTTNEKVYVVTPMSTHQWTEESVTTPRYTTSPAPTTSSEKTTKGFVIRGRGATKQATPLPTTSVDASAFRSPRFTVRPTPAPRALETSKPAAQQSRGNRYYTVPTPTPFNASPSTERAIEKRSSTAEVSEQVTVGPSVDSGRHSKVVTVVTSSSSSSVPAHGKKATRLTVKPAKVPDSPPPVLEEEVAAAVREVSAIDLKRKSS